jgi:hypothetical protein
MWILFLDTGRLQTQAAFPRTYVFSRDIKLKSVRSLKYSNIGNIYKVPSNRGGSTLCEIQNSHDSEYCDGVMLCSLADEHQSFSS